MRGQLTALILPFVLWELYVQGGVTGRFVFYSDTVTLHALARNLANVRFYWRCHQTCQHIVLK